MNEDKLNEICKKLDLPQEDLSKIKRQYLTVKIVSPFIGIFITALATLGGYLMGKNAHTKLVNRETGSVYPYVVPSLFLLGSTFNTSKKSIIRKRNLILIFAAVLTTILSVIAYTVAFDAGQPVEYYSGSIMYGVYSREQ